MTDLRDNDTWLRDLRSEGALREQALADLMALLARQLPYGLSRYIAPSDPHSAALIEEVIQETLMRVLERLDTFEGRSQFTTWVFKIAVHMALNELRRKRWQDVSLDALDNEAENPQPLVEMLATPGATPETTVARQDALERILKLIREELTSRQQAALLAVSFEGVPMEEVARRMNTNRNALYKLIHDARVSLKRRLEQEGLSPEALMEMFSQDG